MTSRYTEKILAESHTEGLRQAYRQHAATFRAWLVAFGVALPVFLVSNDAIWQTFSHSDNARCITYLFLTGVAVQVALALIDKYADLFCLSVIMGWRDRDTKPAQFGVWWLAYDWPSISADLVTIALFAGATYMTLGVLLH